MRDQVVRALAKLSLICVLALMGALFVGSAAMGTPDPAAQTSVSADKQPEQEGLLAQADPVGLLIGAAVIGVGLSVLVVAAFKPHPRDEAREFAEFLRD